jgi:Uma2 family endonuclease
MRNEKGTTRVAYPDEPVGESVVRELLAAIEAERQLSLRVGVDLSPPAPRPEHATRHYGSLEAWLKRSEEIHRFLERNHAQSRRQMTRVASRESMEYAAVMLSWSPALAPNATQTGPRLDIEEWANLPEDASGELVNGQLSEEEMPDPIHGLAVSWLIALFRAWLGTRGGFVFDSDVKFIVSATHGRKPDVSVFFPERPAPPRRGALREPPDIMVEVVSASPVDERRDRVEKMDEYAAFGVHYYWLVDPALGSVEIFELSNGRFVRVLAGTAGLVRNVPGCPNLELNLEELWGELGRLNPNE